MGSLTGSTRPAMIPAVITVVFSGQASFLQVTVKGQVRATELRPLFGLVDFLRLLPQRCSVQFFPFLFLFGNSNMSRVARIGASSRDAPTGPQSASSRPSASIARSSAVSRTSASPFSSRTTTPSSRTAGLKQTSQASTISPVRAAALDNLISLLARIAQKRRPHVKSYARISDLGKIPRRYLATKRVCFS